MILCEIAVSKSPPRDLNTLGGRHVVDVVKVEVEVAVELAELVGLGKTGEGIFVGDLRESYCSFDQTGNALG
jgi:hypothetical protein